MPAFRFFLVEMPLFFSWRRLGGLGAFKNGVAARALLHKDREPNGCEHEDHCTPCCQPRQQVGGATRTKSCLRTLTAECARKISALALLQQHDDDKENTDDDVENKN